MLTNKNGSKLALLCVCQVEELLMKLHAPGGHQPLMSTPTNRDPAALVAKPW